ncbi:MAG: hypothetical protein E5Y32_28910 [Mesorhizobium sp.]|nr:MAG: hypothetical protein E5Y32_28910 [Mesorhizobium sp.]
MTADAFLLHGTPAVEAEPVSLRAGALSADFVNGNLRTIRHGGIEVLRAIAYIVRDRDWGTYEPALTDLVIDQGADTFSVSYSASCAGPDGSRLDFRATIKGSADGQLVFDVSALPENAFETNRCGFCILHPIAGLAGSPVTVEHTDGSVVATKLPELIDPWQPFKDLRAITHEVRPGVTAECRMEGDAFEMEDQRNWSDASYKTYVRPLALPWPYMLPAGRTVRQTVSVRVTGDGRAPVTRTPADLLDFVSHCTCPIVHAADDLSVMQSLEALPFITQSARAIFGAKPYRIGPSTIAMRQNPYGGATKANPHRQRIAMADRDPRHAGLFAAAWTIGYAARVAPAGLEMLTLSSFSGSFGVLAESAEPVGEGEPRPIFQAVQGLCELAGFRHVAARTSDETRLLTLAGRSAAGQTVMWLANLTASEVTVDISGIKRRRLVMTPYAITRIG